MKTSLDGQVAIVTGGARGIGLGIARLMAERGAKIVVWDRDLEPLKATPGFTPAMAQSVDVADYGSVERAFIAAVAKFGQIHIIVNNAGINGPIKPTWEYPLEDWDRVVAIDMTSVFYASRLAATRSQSSSGYSQVGLIGPLMPALLTTMWIWPNCATAALNALSTDE